MGNVLNVRWAHIGIVATGPYCTAQGVIQQFGEVGVGLSILVRFEFYAAYALVPEDIN
jgi:hypothetical protein